MHEDTTNGLGTEFPCHSIPMELTLVTYLSNSAPLFIVYKKVQYPDNKIIIRTFCNNYYLSNKNLKYLSVGTSFLQ